MDFAGIDKPFDFDDLCALEFNFINILRRDYHILLRFKLIPFDNVFGGESFAAFFAFFLVADGAVILFVQLVEPDGFFRFHCVINADGNGNQRKPDMAFPDGPHNSPRSVIRSSWPVIWTLIFRYMVAFIRLARSMKLAEEKANS